MALSRLTGDEELYFGGVFALRRVQALTERKITHILSVIDYSLDKSEELRGKFEHLSVDIDDDEDADLLVHLPRMVRFIEAALYPDGADGTDTAKRGSVYVHCAMGKSRSASAVVAYLLWKHPNRFGAADRRNPDRKASAEAAVGRALQWVRQTREMAEPNDGFMSQLAMWWDMGCPADSDDAVERQPAYQRWLYKREVQESARIGRAPDWIRFEDEARAKQTEESQIGEGGGGCGGRLEIRCKKCRRVLATRPFVLHHPSDLPTPDSPQSSSRPPCPHVFLEPLSWMRPSLQTGDLEGRLVCPNTRCGASVGRFAWQGFKCSCGEWVCPAISLQRSKVDEVVLPAGPAGAGSVTSRQAATLLGIRMPPSLRKESL